MRLQAAGRIQAIWNRVLGRSWLRSAAHESGGAGGHRVASLTATPAALRARLSVLVRRRPAAAGGLVVAALLLAACSGFTTGATNIAKQSDGSYSAQLNFVASCGSGEHCSWYVHYRRVGTSTWTNVPSTPHGPVTGPVSSVSLFEAATGLTAGARYEYQVCGNFQPGQPFICVGPDGQTNTTTKFTAAAWSLQSIPSHLDPTGVLSATSCSSATACTAVGSSSGGPLVERWDGSTWTTQTTPSPSGGDLNAVSCASATSCTAVGHNGTEATLAEFWDGSTWTIQATPTPGVGLSVPSPFLGGVSCTSATACTAVGSFLVGGLAARWDGSSWTMQDATGGLMNGVSCTSASACIAVGTEESEFEGKMVWLPSAARWDGSTWTSQTLPAPSGADLSDLNGVSCTSATACTAVGYYISGNSNRPLAERWDGSTWTIQTTPTASGTTVSRLNGVSCTSATACTAVGDDNSNQVTLAERWNGSTWTIQATPSGVSLNGVSCTSATACIAVGSGGLAERWDGSTWTTQTTPSGGSLNAVSCTSATACTAVGESGPSIGNGGTLAERWDGTSWTIQTTPNPSGPPSSNLLGVSCTSATKCTAVGLSGDGQTIASISPLAERYSA